MRATSSCMLQQKGGLILDHTITRYLSIKWHEVTLKPAWSCHACFRLDRLSGADGPRLGNKASARLLFHDRPTGAEGGSTFMCCVGFRLTADCTNRHGKPPAQASLISLALNAAASGFSCQRVNSIGRRILFYVKLACRLVLCLC